MRSSIPQSIRQRTLHVQCGENVFSTKWYFGSSSILSTLGVHRIQNFAIRPDPDPNPTTGEKLLFLQHNSETLEWLLTRFYNRTSTWVIISLTLTVLNNKLPGCDGLPAEIFKKGGDAMIIWLQDIFSCAWKQGRIPEDWGKGCQCVICPVFKNKGDRAECGNYRGISLLPHITKIYERILERTLRSL